MTSNPILDNMIRTLEADLKKFSIRVPVVMDDSYDLDNVADIGERDDGLAFDELTIVEIMKRLPTDRYRIVFLFILLNQLGYYFKGQDMADVWGITSEAIYERIKAMGELLRKAHIEDII